MVASGLGLRRSWSSQRRTQDRTPCASADTDQSHMAIALLLAATGCYWLLLAAISLLAFFFPQGSETLWDQASCTIHVHPGHWWGKVWCMYDQMTLCDQKTNGIGWTGAPADFAALLLFSRASGHCPRECQCPWLGMLELRNRIQNWNWNRTFPVRIEMTLVILDVLSSDHFLSPLDNLRSIHCTIRSSASLASGRNAVHHWKACGMYGTSSNSTSTLAFLAWNNSGSDGKHLCTLTFSKTSSRAFQCLLWSEVLTLSSSYWYPVHNSSSMNANQRAPVNHPHAAHAGHCPCKFHVTRNVWSQNGPSRSKH